MRTLCFSIAALFASAALPCFGSAGMFDQFIIVNTGAVTFYDLNAATGNPDFQSANLGSFQAGTDSILLGGQGKSYKNSGSNVTGMQLFYRIFQGTPGGVFSSLGYSFQVDNVNGIGGDQQWGTDFGTPYYTANILAGLTPGSYFLEAYSSISTNGVDAANPINTASYTASFTVVPEPSRALLGLMGLMALALRRRRA